MAKDDKTRIEKKYLLSSEEKGHVTKDGKVMENRFLGSEQVGRIKDGQVSMDRTIPDGGLRDFGKRPISRIEGKMLYGADKPFISVEYPYGYVDEKGNVWRNSTWPRGVLLENKIIGKVKGNDPEKALAYYSIQFQRIVEQYEKLNNEVKETPERERHLALFKVENMLRWVPEAEALGDFDSLISNLRNLEKKLLEDLGTNLEKKEKLLKNLENISTADWKEASEKVRAIEDEWKSTGPVTKEKTGINEQYHQILDKFYNNKRDFFQKMDKERNENLSKKRRLISEFMNVSTDNYKTAGEEIKRIQDAWKEIGPVPKDYFEEINGDYKKLLDNFYDGRRKFFERLNEERKDNLETRNRIIENIQSVDTEDLKEASATLKELIAEWKSTGPVPKDEWEAINERFNDVLKEKHSEMSQIYEDRQSDWESNHSD